MQLLGLLILAVAVATGSAIPLEGAEDRMMELILAVTDFAKAQAALHDPLYLNGSKSEDYDTGDIRGTFLISNKTLSGFSDIVIDSMRTDPEKLAAHFRVRLPQVRLAADFSAKGEADLFGYKVSGSGHVKVTLYNATAHLLYTSLVETESTGLKVKATRIIPDIQDISVEIDGLTVKGLSTNSQFEKSVVMFIYNYLSGMLPLEMLYSSDLPRLINPFINGRSMDEVIQWLKNHKIDPINPFNMLSFFQL